MSFLLVLLISFVFIFQLRNFKKVFYCIFICYIFWMVFLASFCYVYVIFKSIASVGVRLVFLNFLFQQTSFYLFAGFVECLLDFCVSCCCHFTFTFWLIVYEVPAFPPTILFSKQTKLLPEYFWLTVLLLLLIQLETNINGSFSLKISHLIFLYWKWVFLFS